jgi:hypothetical protein
LLNDKGELISLLEVGSASLPVVCFRSADMFGDFVGCRMFRLAPGCTFKASSALCEHSLLDRHDPKIADKTATESVFTRFDREQVCRASQELSQSGLPVLADAVISKPPNSRF